MPRIMIVDDALFMRTAIKKMVENHNYEVVGEASDGDEAVKMYKRVRPDVTTMDITMPTMSGIEAVKEIISMDKNAKFVMVSAMGQEELIREAVMNGASSFIVKPFQEDRLMEVLDGITKREE
jgi:two-component system chemotaxis response regulator CheY